MAFIEIFKKQNQNFNKMVEAGEENSKNLRQMFNQIFEAFLHMNKDKDTSPS